MSESTDDEPNEFASVPSPTDRLSVIPARVQADLIDTQCRLDRRSARGLL